MMLSENQSKELLCQYGVLIPEGRLAHTPEQAEKLCKEIKARKYVVKAQIAAGGRGLAGGIKFAATPSAVANEARALLNSKLVTEQTAASGETVHSVYVEAAIDIAKNFYIAISFDPNSGRPILLPLPLAAWSSSNLRAWMKMRSKPIYLTTPQGTG